MNEDRSIKKLRDFLKILNFFQVNEDMSIEELRDLQQELAKDKMDIAGLEPTIQVISLHSIIDRFELSSHQIS